MFSNPEYVYEVYKERSFSKAAKNLFISQPALSVTIKRIENRIGTPIFDRSTNPVGLTECGQKYIEVIKQYMDLDSAACLRSIEKVRALQQKFDAKVFFGHDPKNFPAYRHAPAYYE